MRVYLASPKSTTHAAGLKRRCVLLSFAEWGPYLEPYVPAFRRILIDSGAYSEFTTGKKVELSAYQEWAAGWVGHADAIAGLDDLSGDWRRSLRNYELFSGGFPTYHITDPPELLDDLIFLSRERKQWLGLGMCGQQKQRDRDKEEWLARTLERVPDGIHVHGWALGAYADHRRLDSIDSTRWLRCAQTLGSFHLTKHLTLEERIAVAAKHLGRQARARQAGARGPSFKKRSEGRGLFGEDTDA